MPGKGDGIAASSGCVPRRFYQTLYNDRRATPALFATIGPCPRHHARRPLGRRRRPPARRRRRLGGADRPGRAVPDPAEEGQVRDARQGDHRAADLVEGGGLDRREAQGLDGRPAHAEAAARTRRDGARSVGLSGVKARYVLNLAGAVDSGVVPLDKAHRWNDEEVVARLTSIKGVGVWTAEMFLIFALARPDVFPVGDLGVRAAIRDRLGLPEMPKPEFCRPLGEPWRPFRSVASWYLWRSLDPAFRIVPHTADERRGARRDLRPDPQERPGDRRLRRPPVPGRRGDRRGEDRRRRQPRRGRGGEGARRHRPLRRPRLHRRPRPRRPRLARRPGPPAGLEARGDDLRHRPGRQRLRAGVARDDGLHEAVHRRVQRQPAGPGLSMERRRRISPTVRRHDGR